MFLDRVLLRFGCVGRVDCADRQLGLSGWVYGLSIFEEDSKRVEKVV